MPLRFLILIFFFLFSHNCRAQNSQCSPSSCGKIQNIRYPFRLKSDPKTCGNKRYILSCENNVTILDLYWGKYLVEAIDYINHTIRLVDPNIQEGNCSSLPRYTLSNYNFSYNDPYEQHQWNNEGTVSVELTKSVIFMSCEKPVKSYLYIDTPSCSNGSSGPLSQHKRHSYVVNRRLSISDTADSCRIEVMTLVSNLGKNYSNASSFMDIHDQLTFGFELSWIPGTKPLPIRIGNCIVFNFDYVPE